MPKAAERALGRGGTECFVSILAGWEITLKPLLGLSAADVEAGIAAVGARAADPVQPFGGASKSPCLQPSQEPVRPAVDRAGDSEDMQIVSSDSRFGEYRQVKGGLGLKLPDVPNILWWISRRHIMQYDCHFTFARNLG